MNDSTTLVHLKFPYHQVMANKTGLCDPTVKSVSGLLKNLRRLVCAAVECLH